jgi:predicted nucleic acid-binding protein
MSRFLLDDVRIGAIALEHGLTIVTRNVRDFSRIPALATVDWSV